MNKEQLMEALREVVRRGDIIHAEILEILVLLSKLEIKK